MFGCWTLSSVLGFRVRTRLGKPEVAGIMFIPWKHKCQQQEGYFKHSTSLDRVVTAVPGG